MDLVEHVQSFLTLWNNQPLNNLFELGAKINSRGQKSFHILTHPLKHMIAIDRPSGTPGATRGALSHRVSVSGRSAAAALCSVLLIVLEL